jgi:hypothetical protein
MEFDLCLVSHDQHVPTSLPPKITSEEFLYHLERSDFTQSGGCRTAGRLRLRPFGRRPASELSGSLLPQAIESAGWLFSPGSLSRDAGNVGSSSHHPDPSNASASTCVIRRDERSNVG